jgi:hypothetical protein
MAKKNPSLAVGRGCELCGVNINHMRSDARFCCRDHKRKASDSKRNYAVEYQKNKEVRRQQALKYYYADHKNAKAKQLLKQKARLPQIAAYEANRRAIKLQRTPRWIGKEEMWLIKEIYDLAARRTQQFGFSWHVDHIIPLQGHRVSGLHVPENMQVIRGVDNISKNNKYEVL